MSTFLVFTWLSLSLLCYLLTWLVVEIMYPKKSSPISVVKTNERTSKAERAFSQHYQLSNNSKFPSETEISEASAAI